METAHDQRVHPGINHTLDFLQKSVYMANMSKLVQGYIHSCPVCSVVKPNRQLPAGQLHPIKAPDIPLYTLSIDFMSRLPPSSTSNNYAMTVTDKFTKYICILLGQDNFSAYDWAHEFYDHVYKDWGSPQTIISDRDLKFTSMFWKALFKRAKVNLQMTTAHHQAADGQAESTVQKVQIALRTMLVNNLNERWEEWIPDAQFALNMTSHTSTGQTPFQALYGVTARSEFTNEPSVQTADEFIEQRR